MKNAFSHFSFFAKKISDHCPIVHDGVFFWNVMMQCKKRVGTGYNNGFGLIENNQNYLRRLRLIAQTIAAVVYRDPSIEVINLCEGPIEEEHVAVFLQALRQFPWMSRFGKAFNKPSESGPNWGLLMLADVRYAVTTVDLHLDEDLKLANRFQLWRLTDPIIQKYIALAHFPFAGDEFKTTEKTLSAKSRTYGRFIHSLLENFRNDCFIFCADFNFNPYLIGKIHQRALDKIPHNNSVVLMTNHLHQIDVKSVTVDGLLLSSREKQTYHCSRPIPDLSITLKAEYGFFSSYLKESHKEWSLFKRNQIKQVRQKIA